MWVDVSWAACLLGAYWLFFTKSHSWAAYLHLNEYIPHGPSMLSEWKPTAMGFPGGFPPGQHWWSIWYQYVSKLYMRCLLMCEFLMEKVSRFFMSRLLMSNCLKKKIRRMIMRCLLTSTWRRLLSLWLWLIDTKRIDFMFEWNSGPSRLSIP